MAFLHISIYTFLAPSLSLSLFCCFICTLTFSGILRSFSTQFHEIFHIYGCIHIHLPRYIIVQRYTAVLSGIWHRLSKIDLVSARSSRFPCVSFEPNVPVDLLNQFMPKQYNHHRSVELYILHTFTYHFMISNRKFLSCSATHHHF